MSDPLVPMSEVQLGSMEAAVGTYESERNEETEAYLEARGIDPLTANEFRLGTCLSPIAGHQRFTGMLSIPYLGPNGDAWSVRFRCLQSHNHDDNFHGKYNGIKGEPTRIFNVGAIHRAGNELHITEGELDCIILSSMGYHAIAIPGVSNWKPHYSTAVRGFSRVYVWGDDDNPGAEFVQHVCKLVRTAKGVPIKGGDITDVYLKDDGATIHQLVEEIRK